MYIFDFQTQKLATVQKGDPTDPCIRDCAYDKQRRLWNWDMGARGTVDVESWNNLVYLENGKVISQIKFPDADVVRYPRTRLVD